jgi:hypothetical protein
MTFTNDDLIGQMDHLHPAPHSAIRLGMDKVFALMRRQRAALP